MEKITDIGIQEWQIRQIEEGLREAEAGDFASDEEVAAIFIKWRERSVRPPERDANGPGRDTNRPE